MVNAVYHDKPLIFIKAVSDTIFDMITAAYHDKPFYFYRGYVSGEARLPSSGSEYVQVYQGCF